MRVPKNHLILIGGVLLTFFILLHLKVFNLSSFSISPNVPEYPSGAIIFLNPNDQTAKLYWEKSFYVPASTNNYVVYYTLRGNPYTNNTTKLTPSQNAELKVDVGLGKCHYTKKSDSPYISYSSLGIFKTLGNLLGKNINIYYLAEPSYTRDITLTFNGIQKTTSVVPSLPEKAEFYSGGKRIAMIDAVGEFASSGTCNIGSDIVWYEYDGKAQLVSLATLQQKADQLSTCINQIWTCKSLIDQLTLATPLPTPDTPTITALTRTSSNEFVAIKKETGVKILINVLIDAETFKPIPTIVETSAPIVQTSCITTWGKDTGKAYISIKEVSGNTGSVVIKPSNTDGLTISQPQLTTGISGYQTAQVVFDVSRTGIEGQKTIVFQVISTNSAGTNSKTNSVNCIFNLPAIGSGSSENLINCPQYSYPKNNECVCIDGYEKVGANCVKSATQSTEEFDLTIPLIIFGALIIIGMLIYFMGGKGGRKR